MMIEADLIGLAICEKHAEVGDGMQSSIIQVHALRLRHKDGATEACAQLVFRRGKHTLSACIGFSFVSFALAQRRCRHRPAHS